MPHRPLIVLTNDDGIRSPGLRAAARALKGLGELRIAAPSSQQTAMGRSHTGRRDARLEPIAFIVDGEPVPAWHCEASPAAVLLHALQVICPERRPDLVVSGINYGENVGTSITASGTVGAAVEAASLGIPALAAAQEVDPGDFLTHGERDWSAAEHFLRHFAARRLQVTLPWDVDLLKLDVPEGATPETPWHLSRLSRQRYFSSRLPDPGPHSCLGDARIHVQVDEESLEPGSDIHTLRMLRQVALTPLSLDATSRADFGEILAALG